MTNLTKMDPESWNKLPQYGIYFIEGSLMSFGNLILALCIWYHEALRSQKQYLVVSFMFLADSLNGFAQLFASIYRTSLLFLGTHDIKVTRWDCMTKLHSLCWTFSEPCAALMLAIVSFDRLVLVMCPFYYMDPNQKSLLYGAIALPYIWSAGSLATALSLAWLSPRTATVEQYCLLSFGHGKSYWAYHGALSVLGAFISIVLFLIFIAIYKRRQHRVARKGSTVSEQNILRKQRHITTSLAYSCLFTFVLFLVPRAVGTAVYYSSLDRASSASIMMILYWIVGNFNAIFNIIIFTIRHKEVRKGVRCMLKCHKLPPDLRRWFGSSVQMGSCHLSSAVHHNETPNADHSSQWNEPTEV